MTRTVPASAAAPTRPATPARRSWSRDRVETLVFGVLRWVVIVVLLVVALFPMYYMVVLSLRSLDEVVHDPHMHERGALQYQDHPELGRIVVQHSPLRFAGSEPRELQPSRTLGADTATVLGRLDLPDAAIAALRRDGVV